MRSTQGARWLAAGTRKIRVLFVDDEDSLVRITVRCLSRHGYEVSGASNGRDALDLVDRAAEQFHVVVTDDRMPELDGPELITALRRMLPDVSVILTSGTDDAYTRAIARGLGVTSYLSKPYMPSQLAELIERAVSS